MPLETLTTGYWSHPHDIPDFYTTVSVGIVSSNTASATRRFERAMDFLDARRIRVDPRLLEEPFTGSGWPAEGQTVWLMAKSKQKQLDKALHKQAGCNYIRVRDISSPRAELVSKHDGLLKETSSHFEIVSSSIVRSFLEAELQTLNRLLWRDKLAAERIGLYVTIAPPSQSPPYVDAPTLHLLPQQTIFASGDPALGEIHLSSAPNKFPFAFWDRSSPVGEARPEATIVVDVTGDPNYHTERFGEQIPKRVARFEAAAYFSSGKFLEFPGWQRFDVKWPPFYFTLPEKKLDALRADLAPGASLLYWSQSQESANAFAAAAQKRALLLGERERLGQVLQSAPFVRALMDAELDRLKPLEEKFSSEVGTGKLPSGWSWRFAGNPNQSLC